MSQQRKKNRHEDNNDICPLQRPAEQEDNNLGQEHEVYERHIKRCYPYIDDLLTAEQRESPGENPRADKQSAHHRAGLGGEKNRLLKHRHVKSPIGNCQKQPSE